MKQTSPEEDALPGARSRRGVRSHVRRRWSRPLPDGVAVLRGTRSPPRIEAPTGRGSPRRSPRSAGGAVRRSARCGRRRAPHRPDLRRGSRVRFRRRGIRDERARRGLLAVPPTPRPVRARKGGSRSARRRPRDPGPAVVFRPPSGRERRRAPRGGALPAGPSSTLAPTRRSAPRRGRVGGGRPRGRAGALRPPDRRGRSEVRRRSGRRNSGPQLPAARPRCGSGLRKRPRTSSARTSRPRSHVSPAASSSYRATKRPSSSTRRARYSNRSSRPPNSRHSNDDSLASPKSSDSVRCCRGVSARAPHSNSRPQRSGPHPPSRPFPRRWAARPSGVSSKRGRAVIPSSSDSSLRRPPSLDSPRERSLRRMRRSR